MARKKQTKWQPMPKAPLPAPVTTESTPVAIQHVRRPSLKVRHNEAIAAEARASILPELSEDSDDLETDDLEADDLEEDGSNESPSPQLPPTAEETQALMDEYLSADTNANDVDDVFDSLALALVYPLTLS